MGIAHTLTSTTATVVVNFTPKVIGASHPNFKRVVELLKNPNTTEAQIAPLLDIPSAITSFTGGAVTVQNGKLYFNGYEVKTSLAKKIMAFINAGDDTLAQPLMRFLENVQQNPDPRAGADLYDWVEASGLPLTGDGYVLAWKAVGNDYMSIHSGRRGKLSHKLGEFVSEPREECDDNPNQTCSRGLHFCSAPYLRHYASGGHRIVVVKIHPKDVVAFPRDYDLQKGRACAYQVVGEVPLDRVSDFYPQGVPVYRGFDAISAQPAPAPVAARPDISPSVGRRYELRDGRVGTCIERSVSLAYLTVGSERIAVRSDNGQQFSRSSAQTHKLDIVADRGVARAERKGMFAVGQTWRARNGQTVKITSINDVNGRPTFPIGADNGGTFTVNGRYYADQTSPMDLVSLVSDVA